MASDPISRLVDAQYATDSSKDNDCKLTERSPSHRARKPPFCLLIVLIFLVLIVIEPQMETGNAIREFYHVSSVDYASFVTNAIEIQFMNLKI